MTRKNMKVSEIVHEELALRKRKEETFDDVLKRELGILPGGIDDLVAFYPEGMTTAVKEIVGIIEERADFERAITEYEDHYAIELDHPESGHTIVQIQFHEDPTEGMLALYRDHHGKMEVLVNAHILEQDRERITSGKDSYPVFVEPVHSGGLEDWHTGVERERFKQELESKISGSYERWG